MWLLREILTRPGFYASTRRFLENRGHDAVPVASLGLSEAEDEELLSVAVEEGRLFVTRDRDFGNLVFVRGLGTGVFYLRMTPVTVGSIHAELENVIETYSAEELKKAFVVIEPGRHRFRKP